MNKQTEFEIFGYTVPRKGLFPILLETAETREEADKKLSALESKKHAGLSLLKRTKSGVYAEVGGMLLL